MNTEECLFCEIAAEREPADYIMQDDEVVAFLDKRPVFKGHVLVIPREHHLDLLTCSAKAATAVFEATRRIAIAVRDGLETDGIFVANNNAVSQSVFHLHVHVVPRRRKDGLRGFMWPRTKYADDVESAEYAAKIRKSLETVE